MSKQPMDKDDLEREILGDTTAYGEFVATFHHWTGLEGNHKRGCYLENITASEDTPPRKTDTVPVKAE